MASQVDPIAFVRRLRSVRRFTEQPLPPELLPDLLDVARWTGSARNLQPWSFVVIREPETLRSLAACEGSAGHLAGAALGILLVMDGGPLYAQETFDEGRLAERLQLAASAYGVASCVGWFKGEGPAQVAALLGIPEGRLIRTVLSFGYEAVGTEGARNSPEHPRKPLADLVHNERW